MSLFYLFFSTIVLALLLLLLIFTLPCLWEINFSSQMVVELSVGCWAWMRPSSGHITILAVEFWNWMEVDSWCFVGGLF